MKTNNGAVCKGFWLVRIFKVSDIFGQNDSNLRTKFRCFGHFRTNSRTKFKIYILCIKRVTSGFVAGTFYKYVMETVFKRPFSDIF